MTCRILKLETFQQVEELLQRYLSMRIRKDAPQAFIEHLTQRRDSWFVEVEDVGLIYLTNVIPTWSAVLNVLFWDGRLGKERREVLREVLNFAFTEFQLLRVQATVSADNTPLQTFYEKSGMCVEGVLRNAWRDEEGLQNIVLLSLVPEEVESWQATKISLD